MNGQRLLSRSTLSDVEKIFPSYVIRVHKSYAVCFYNISLIEANQILVGDSEIPIGKKHKNFFHLKFKEHKLLTVKR